MNAFVSLSIMMKSNRRKFIGTAAVLAASTTVSAAPLVHSQDHWPIVHHVFFWLKNPESTADRDQLIAGIKTLKKITTVKQLHVGTVASTAQRDVVDNSWNVSELMYFADLEGQAVYQDHPVHLEFIKNCGHLWRKVTVYDMTIV